jgi:hypothetical protein
MCRYVPQGLIWSDPVNPLQICGLVVAFEHKASGSQVR